MSHFIDGQDPPTKSWQMPKGAQRRPKSAKTVDPPAVSSLGGGPVVKIFASFLASESAVQLCSQKLS